MDVISPIFFAYMAQKVKEVTEDMFLNFYCICTWFTHLIHYTTAMYHYWPVPACIHSCMHENQPKLM